MFQHLSTIPNWRISGFRWPIHSIAMIPPCYFHDWKQHFFSNEVSASRSSLAEHWQARAEVLCGGVCFVRILPWKNRVIWYIWMGSICFIPMWYFYGLFSKHDGLVVFHSYVKLSDGMPGMPANGRLKITNHYEPRDVRVLFPVNFQTNPCVLWKLSLLEMWMSWWSRRIEMDRAVDLIQCYSHKYLPAIKHSNGKSTIYSNEFPSQKHRPLRGFPSYTATFDGPRVSFPVEAMSVFDIKDMWSAISYSWATSWLIMVVCPEGQLTQKSFLL